MLNNMTEWNLKNNLSHKVPPAAHLLTYFLCTSILLIFIIFYFYFMQLTKIPAIENREKENQ
jgi:hypothetical protein